VGEVRHVAAGFTFPGVAAENYRMDPARGGGALYDVGHYAASAVEVAYERATPEAVRARCRWSASGVDLDAEVVADWPGRRTAETRAGMDSPYAAWLRISGAEGKLELPSHAYAPVPGAPTDVLLSDARGTYALRTKPEPTYQRMVEAVSARIRGDDTAWVVPPADTLATAVLLDLARADCSP